MSNFDPDNELERILPEPAATERPSVLLRPIDDADLDAVFEFERDPEAIRMAAFTSGAPDDRPAFDARMTRIRTDPTVLTLAIEVDGDLVGTIATFEMEGDREVTYWIDRAHWGRGIAGRALDAILALERTRPLSARAASDNASSLRVLERAGFVRTGTDISFAPGRAAEIEETLLRLDS